MRLMFTPTSWAPWELAATARMESPSEVFDSTRVITSATTMAPTKAIRREYDTTAPST